MEFDIEKYEKESLGLIYNEAISHLTETFKSFREVTNKSYVTIGIYFSIISYSLSKLFDLEYSEIDPFFFSIAIIMFITSGILLGNILPAKMTMPGCKPEKLIHSYYEAINGENQLKLYYKQRIIDLDTGINHNIGVVNIRAKRLRISITLSIAFTFISFFIYGVVV